MDIENNVEVGKGTAMEVEKTDSDESCILIEKDVTTIEVEDSFVEEAIIVKDSSSFSNGSGIVPGNPDSGNDDSQNSKQTNGADESQPSDDCQELDVTLNGNVSAIVQTLLRIPIIIQSCRLLGKQSRSFGAN